MTKLTSPIPHEKNISHKDHLNSTESKLSTTWKTNKDEKQQKNAQLKDLKDKLNDTRTKIKVLEKKIRKMDAKT